MGLGPPVCTTCKVSYDNIHYINEEGNECVKWMCPMCKREDVKDYALTISKELFEEIYGKKDE